MSGLLAKAYVDIEPELAPLDAGLAKGKQAISEFVRDAQGRLRDSRGRLVGLGKDAGEGFGSGFGGGLAGTFRNAFRGAGGLLGTLGVTLGTAGLAKTLYDSATAASDLNEAVSKNQFTFRRSFGTVNKTVDELADRFGLVKTEALDAAANIGLIGQAAGMTDKQSADLASQFTKLAADASSFFNVPMEDALRRLQSGLVGESEPMRRFGVLLSEDAVKAEALSLGLVRSASEMTEQAKVAARASLILKGMATVTGDLERTQDSAANKLRKFRGEVENFKADFGQALTGPLTDALKLTQELTLALSKMTGQNAATAGEATGGFFGGIVNGLRNMLAASQDAAAQAARNNPNGLGSYFAPAAGFLGGGVREALFPDQNLADRRGDVAKGGMGATPAEIAARRAKGIPDSKFGAPGPAEVAAEAEKRGAAIARGLAKENARIGAAKGDAGATERLLGGDPAFEVGKLIGRAFNRAEGAVGSALSFTAAQKQARDRQDEQERKARRSKLDAGVTTLEGAKQLSQVAALTRDPQVSELKKLNEQTEDVKTFLSTLVKFAARPQGGAVLRGRE